MKEDCSMRLPFWRRHPILAITAFALDIVLLLLLALSWVLKIKAPSFTGPALTYAIFICIILLFALLVMQVAQTTSDLLNVNKEWLQQKAVMLIIVTTMSIV